jgi:hypothetical protein
MLNEGLKKKFLFGTTMIAGFAAVAVSVAPAYAQDSAAAGAPAQTAPDPAVPNANADDRNQVSGNVNRAGDAVQDDAAELRPWSSPARVSVATRPTRPLR